MLKTRPVNVSVFTECLCMLRLVCGSTIEPDRRARDCACSQPCRALRPPARCLPPAQRPPPLAACADTHTSHAHMHTRNTHNTHAHAPHRWTTFTSPRAAGCTACLRKRSDRALRLCACVPHKRATQACRTSGCSNTRAPHKRTRALRRLLLKPVQLPRQRRAQPPASCSCMQL